MEIHNRLFRVWVLTLIVMISGIQLGHGQISPFQLNGADMNSIQVSVPFLTIAPDGRASGMGDIGVASMPDVNSQHWNAAKYVFAEKRGGGAFTFAPWLTNVIPNINHYYLAGYYMLNGKSALSSSLRYLSLGKVDLSSVGGAYPSEFNPYELAVDAGYSRMFTDHFSGGLVLRYIHSDLAAGETNPPGRSVAGDMGLYYQSDIQPEGRGGQWALGLNISNIGTPVSYSEDAEKTPIPTNLRLGGSYSFSIGEDHGISLLTELNKLLVPTSGLYELDTISNELILVRGKVDPSSVIRGMYQSFYDAPGVHRSNGSYSVIAEEFHEITFALGAEYWYKKRLAFRSGYHHEHASKGNREYFTFGAGVRSKFLSFDLSYLLPVDGENSPLFNTFRFTLLAEFGS